MRLIGGALAASLGVAACGGSAAANRITSSPATSTYQNPSKGNTVPAEPNSPPSEVSVTFDSRPGPNPGPSFSNVIQVYPGPRATHADEQADGTFMNGQTATALCEAMGRTVHTHSEQPVGEQLGISSNKWAEIVAGGQDYFATFVYLSNASDAAAGRLPSCTDVP